MRYIRKRSEPPEFAAWKSAGARTWEDLDESRNRPRKQRVKDALLKEQGHLCCYCCRSIQAGLGHIEHLAPKKRYPKGQIDYANLLVSCDGISAPAAHCGHKKGEQELAVTPLQSDCAAFFRYTQDGQILPAVATARHAPAEDTICKLGLGSDRLTELRKRVIRVDLGLEGPRRGSPLTRAELHRLYTAYREQDRSGADQLPPFLPARLYVLSQYLP